MPNWRPGGSAGVRQIYARHGAGENQFGVTLGKLRGLAKKLKSNHPLALELWATGNADAMILATMLMAPAQVTRADAERWVKSLTYFKLIDELVDNVLVQTPFADALRVRWMESPMEMVGRAGWGLLNARIVAELVSAGSTGNHLRSWRAAASVAREPRRKISPCPTNSSTSVFPRRAPCFRAESAWVPQTRTSSSTPARTRLPSMVRRTTLRLRNSWS